MTGSIHAQGENLHSNIKVEYIYQWNERGGVQKLINYIKALFQIWYLIITKYRKHEIFFLSVPPMGYLLNLLVKNRFSFLIWDVYPDTLKITGLKESHPVYRLWSYLNKKSFHKAYKMYTISDKMADLLSQYSDKDKIIVQPIWSIMGFSERIPQEQNIFIRENQLQNKFIVQYSGNIGLTHNVEVLLEIAEQLIDNEDIHFQIIGRGPRKEYLKKMVLEKGLKNCSFLPFQSDELFPHSLSAAHIGVVILDSRIGNGSVPSKSYNLMSLGIPSLYIASKDSQLAQYCAAYDHGVCFEPQQTKAAANFILELRSQNEYYKRLSENASSAAENFKRKNADLLVDKYIK